MLRFWSVAGHLATLVSRLRIPSRIKTSSIDPPIPAAPIQPAADDLATMPTTELRKRCAAAGFKWRDARAKGKHLRKVEMLQALMA